MAQSNDLFFSRTGMDRDRVQSTVDEALKVAPTTASCSWNTARANHSPSTTAG